jgi:hypothetical protein
MDVYLRKLSRNDPDCNDLTLSRVHVFVEIVILNIKTSPDYICDKSAKQAVFGFLDLPYREGYRIQADRILSLPGILTDGHFWDDATTQDHPNLYEELYKKRIRPRPNKGWVASVLAFESEVEWFIFGGQRRLR